MKQETLEEVAEKRYPEDGSFIIMDVDIAEFQQIAFKVGAKWNQERSYSEEEVKNILFEWSVYKVNTAFSDGEIMDYEQWFEQFKKK